MRNTAALLLRSFFKGVIILAPIAITIYIIFWIFFKIDTLIPIEGFPRGLGFVLIISSVTIIGYLGTRFFIGKAIFDFFDHVLERTPGIKFIYSSVKEVMSSFVGDKKRFNKPVWVCVSTQPEIFRIGFLTQPDMSYLGMEQKVAVYLPHSYAISGWVIVVNAVDIRPVTTMSSAEAMKFAVSGGITISDENASNGAKIST
ncbi:MAG: DUF502 domain-containing protein [Chitinophagaceae bacterium]